MKQLYGRTVGERIRSLRESMGLSQMDIAREFRLGGKNTVSHYERDNRDVPLDLILDYSRKFNVSTDWILKGDDPDEDSAREMVMAYEGIRSESVRKIAVDQVRLLGEL